LLSNGDEVVVQQARDAEMMIASDDGVVSMPCV